MHRCIDANIKCFRSAATCNISINYMTAIQPSRLKFVNNMILKLTTSRSCPKSVKISVPIAAASETVPVNEDGCMYGALSLRSKTLIVNTLTVYLKEPGFRLVALMLMLWNSNSSRS